MAFSGATDLCHRTSAPSRRQSRNGAAYGSRPPQGAMVYEKRTKESPKKERLVPCVHAPALNSRALQPYGAMATQLPQLHLHEPPGPCTRNAQVACSKSPQAQATFRIRSSFQPKRKPSTARCVRSPPPQHTPPRRAQAGPIHVPGLVCAPNANGRQGIVNRLKKKKATTAVRRLTGNNGLRESGA